MASQEHNVKKKNLSLSHKKINLNNIYFFKYIEKESQTKNLHNSRQVAYMKYNKKCFYKNLEIKKIEFTSRFNHKK